MHNYLKRIIDLGMSYATIYMFIIVSLATTITEIFGVSIFLPIFQYMKLEGDIDALASDSVLWTYIIDGFSFFNLNVSIAILLIISFSLFILRQFFLYIRLVYTTAVTQRLIQTQRDKIFSKYIDADTEYHDRFPTGDFVNVVVNEVEHAVNGIMSPVGLIVYLIMLVGYISVLLLLSWEMTLVSTVILLLTSQIPRVWINRSAKTGRNLVDANTTMSKFLVERLHSPRLVRLSATEFAEKSEFYKATHSQRKYAVLGSILQAKTDISMEPILVGLSLFFLYMSYTVFHLQIEIIGLYLVAALRLMPAVKGIVRQWQLIQSYSGSIEVIENRIKSMNNSIEVDTGITVLDDQVKDIVFKNISYKYSNAKKYTLTNVNIEFKVNQINAIVGESGSGKSTLIDLIPRLRLPVDGCIYINGVDINVYTLESLRKKIAYAPQFPQIFNGTVKKHILYGKHNATDNEILEAIKLSGSEDFINHLPQKLDTVLGEGSVKLSGGQNQRLDLARALIKKSDILILDEPTSSLDIESEIKFKQILNKIREETNTTIIIVTHRLSSVYDADKIIVLSDGKVEVTGNHSELIKGQNWYSRVWKMQNEDNDIKKNS